MLTFVVDLRVMQYQVFNFDVNQEMIITVSLTHLAQLFSILKIHKRKNTRGSPEWYSNTYIKKHLECTVSQGILRK